jgi:hypothetical protein
MSWYRYLVKGVEVERVAMGGSARVFQMATGFRLRILTRL